MAGGVGQVVGTASVVMRLVTDRFDQQLAQVQRRLNMMASRSTAIRLALSPIQMGLGGARDLLQTMPMAVAAAAGMETAMVRLGRVTGLPATGLRSLTDELKDMSTVIPVGVEELFRIATMSAKMGISGRGIGMFTRAVAEMSVILDDMPVEEAANKMARLMNVFRLGHDQIRGVASAIVALDFASTASARDIIEMTTRMSGLASVMKLTLPQTMSLATAMREAGVEVGVGGTAMSQLLARMAGSRDAGFARIAGLRPDAFRRMVDVKPMEALNRFFEGLRKMSPREGIKALEQLHFTGRLTAGTYEQLARVFEKVSKFKGIADKEFVTGTSIQKGFSAQANTTAARLELLWNNLKLAAVEIGQHLKPAVDGLSEGLGDLFKDIRAYLQDHESDLQAWGQRIRRTISNVGVVFRQFPLVMEYIVETITEKMQQVDHIIRNSAGPLAAIFSWLGETVGEAFSTSLGKAMHKAWLTASTLLLKGMIDFMTHPLAQALMPTNKILLAGLFGTFDPAEMKAQIDQGVAQQKAAIDQQQPNFPAFPKADMAAVLQGLPVNPRRAVLEAKIKAARADQLAENVARRARMDERDQQTRTEAAMDRFAMGQAATAANSRRRRVRGFHALATPTEEERRFLMRGRSEFAAEAAVRDTLIRESTMMYELDRVQAFKNKFVIERGRAFDEQLNRGQDEKRAAALKAGKLYQQRVDERLQRAREAMGIGKKEGPQKVSDNSDKQTSLQERMVVALEKMLFQGVPAVYDA